MALSFVKSWHPNLNMGLLAAHRASTKVELAVMAEPLATWVSDLASYAAWDEYVLERAADGTPLLEDDYALTLGDPEGSANETGDKEIYSSVGLYVDTEGEADTGASNGVGGASTS
ncbi:hypothetical protein D1007_14425 [Hordeum vulgare]|nr:hypothetical protein D1007_14425 [Hordeum vulgare]